MNKLNKCIECGSKVLIEFNDTIKHEEDGKVYIIKDVPAIKCDACGEVYYTAEASKYIDKQLWIFRSNGFVNNSKEAIKSKGYSQEELGNLLDLTKQRINQITKDTNLDAQTMIKIANAINEPVENIFKFKRVVQKNNEYYLE